MKVSVIILNWNGDADDCVAACESALQQTYSDTEIILVDNGSTNDSSNAVAQRCNGVRIIYSGANLGVAGGRNFGAAQATGELLFFLENDGKWESPAFIAEAVALFERHADIAVLYNVVVGMQRGELQSHAITAQMPELVLVSRFSGGACVIRTNVFRQFGGFPADFFRQGEERFLALQIYEAGYKICYWTKYRLLHRGSHYAGKNTAVMRLNFEHELKTVARLYPPQNYRRVFWLKVLAWLPRFVAAGDARYFFSILPSLPRWLRERRDYRPISLPTLALLEAITRGRFRTQCATEVDIRAAKTDVPQPQVIAGFLARTLLRETGY